jgi:hypothetical protein
MDGKRSDSEARVARRPPRAEVRVRRRWLVGSGAAPGHRLVLNLARPERRDRPAPDQPSGGGGAGLL